MRVLDLIKYWAKSNIAEDGPAKIGTGSGPRERLRGFRRQPSRVFPHPSGQEFAP